MWSSRAAGLLFSHYPPPTLSPHQVWSSRAAGLLFTQYFWFHQCFLLEGAQLRSLKVRLDLCVWGGGMMGEGVWRSAVGHLAPHHSRPTLTPVPHSHPVLTPSQDAVAGRLSDPKDEVHIIA